ncbi:MAG: hypothetical protein AB8I80_14130, partial [Anaerolineae bacterium]
MSARSHDHPGNEPGGGRAGEGRRR